MALKTTLFPLYTAEDEKAVVPVLEALKAKGFAIGAKGRQPKKEDAVLFFLSEHVTEDKPEIDSFLRYDAEKLTVIPVRLDGAKSPDVIESAILARNAVSMERYTPEELAGRIADALAKPSGMSKKLRTGLIIAAALLILAGIGILIWRNTQTSPGQDVTVTETSSSAPSPTPTEVPVYTGGIPPEDLSRIMEIVFVGDTYRWYTNADAGYKNGSSYSRGYQEIAYRTWEDDFSHFYSTEDGHEFTPAHYDDLSWLSLLPNLKHITLCCVEAEIPDLSGLKKLATVRYCNNQIGTLEWLRGSTIGELAEFSGTDITDFSPLTSCGSLHSVNLDLSRVRDADFSGFAPPSLRSFWIDNGNELNSFDLSRIGECVRLASLQIADAPFTGNCDLSGCRSLHDVHLRHTRVSDLSFLSVCTNLEELFIENASLGTLDGIGELKNLLVLNLESVRLHDISAVAGCSSLREFRLSGYTFNEDLTDLSALTVLPRLHTIMTHTSNISDLNFLNDLKNKDGISLHFSAPITDYSGLAAIRSFKEAHFNVNGRDFNELILPYIQNTRFGSLELFDCGNVDLSALPTVSMALSITRGDLKDLSGLSQPCSQLRLINCQYLTSLEGFTGLTGFGGGKGELYVEGCPRLVDWSALSGLRLTRIDLSGTFTVPDFSETNARYIRFNQVDSSAVPDLACLKGLDKTLSYDFDFTGMDHLPDLLPLFELHGGHLCVPPHLAGQAEELVHDTRFESFEVRYPDGSWNPDDSSVMLLSLEEAETLPKSVLVRVTDLCMAGDVIFDPSRYWVEEDWSSNPPSLYLRRHGSSDDERVPVDTGTILSDLSVLKNLTGLRNLELYKQPMETLDGIQYLESLQNLNLMECASLTDVSAAFTLQSLESLNLNHSPVTDLGGLSNLYGLRKLDLEGIDISDLSVFDHLNEEIEINFSLPLMTYAEFLALPDAVLANLREIEIAGDFVYSPWRNLWVEEDWSFDPVRLFLHDDRTDSRTPIAEGSLSDLSALPVMPRLNTLRIDSQPLAGLSGLEKQPVLRKIEVRRCYGITDIAPLLELKELERICVAYTNVESIEGVQTLPHLVELNLAPSRISDLSPLASIDYSYAETPDEGGWTQHFSLQVDNLQDLLSPEQYGYLAFIPNYSELNINNTDWNLWMDALEGSRIRSIHMEHCSLTNEALELFAAMHPEVEEIYLSWNPNLTDLSPLLTLDSLRYAEISRNDMRQAPPSLGEGYGFRLEIRD